MAGRTLVTSCCGQRECGAFLALTAWTRCVGELRSLLGFLYRQGLTPRPLGAVVPPVAGWRDTGVPKGIPAGDVERLLDSCDRGDPIGSATTRS